MQLQMSWRRFHLFSTQDIALPISQISEKILMETTLYLS